MMHCIAHKFLVFSPTYKYIYISFEAICIRQRKYFYTRENIDWKFSYVILWFIFIQFIAHNNLINFIEKNFSFFTPQFINSRKLAFFIMEKRINKLN